MNDGGPAWTHYASGLEGDTRSEISRRLISEEPMVSPNANQFHEPAPDQRSPLPVHHREFGNIRRVWDRVEQSDLPDYNEHRLDAGISTFYECANQLRPSRPPNTEVYRGVSVSQESMRSRVVPR